MLSDKRWYIRQQACLSIRAILDCLSEEAIETLLPKIIERLRDERGDVRNAATPACATLLAKISAAQRERHFDHVLSLLDFQNPFVASECHKTLSALADAFSAQQLRTVLPMLLASLSIKDISPYSCLTLKCYICKSSKDPAEQSALVSIRDEVKNLLTSQESTTRKAALEIATFPGILRLWAAGGLPKEKLLECLCLQKMQGLSEILWPEKHPTEASLSVSSMTKCI